MQVESSVKPNKFEIEDIGNGRLTVSFFSNIQEIEVSRLDSEEKTIKYIYESYKIELKNRPGLTEEIEEKFENWLEFAKDCEYMQLATQIREKRNELLAETDKEMCIDRMGIEIPEEINAVNLLTVVTNVFKGIGNILNNKMSKYRQELRDITKQEGFPYNVVWPTKED